MTRLAAALVAVSVTLAACGASSTDGDLGDAEPALRVLTHRGAHLPDDLADRFMATAGVGAIIAEERDADAVVALLASVPDPSLVADVVVGIDTLAIGALVGGDLTESYRPLEVERLDPDLTRDDGMATPISTIDICFNYDRSAYEIAAGQPEASEAGDERAVDEEAAEGDEEPAAGGGPASLTDLTVERFNRQVVIPDPRTDRIGQWFLAATHQWLSRGSDDSAWVAFIEGLHRNGLVVTETWQDAYFGRFSEGTSRGDRPIVLASGLMPAVTERFLLPNYTVEPPAHPATAVLDDGCGRIVTYAAIVRGTDQRQPAGRFLDLLVTPETQFAMYGPRGGRPARIDLVLPEEVERYDPGPLAPLVDPDVAGPAISGWIEQWVSAGTASVDGPEGDAPAEDG